MVFLLLVPTVAPLVNVEDMTSPHSFAVSWTLLPEEHVMGRLLGYHVTYKAVKVADERVDSEEVATMTVDGPDVLHAKITGLKSYSSYVVQVAGFTSKGNGLSSVEVTGGNEKCIIHQKSVISNFLGGSRFPSFVQTASKITSKDSVDKLNNGAFPKQHPLSTLKAKPWSTNEWTILQPYRNPNVCRIHFYTNSNKVVLLFFNLAMKI